MALRTLLASLLLAGTAFAAETIELPTGLPLEPAQGAGRAVLDLMKHNTQAYGSDTALLQGLLLTHSLQGAAVLDTESTLLGFEQSAGRKYVALRVASGIVLNDQQLTRNQRLERIWHVILEHTLLKYPTFTAPADGLAIEIQYNHRSFDEVADLYAEIDAGPVERAKFYLLGSDLAEFLGHRLGPQAFLDRSRVLLDDQPVKLQLTEVSMPPRPELPATANNAIRSQLPKD